MFDDLDMNAFFSLVIIGFIVFVFIWRRTKGKRGEKTVAALLSLLPKKDYRVINDLVIQFGGYSTQIDHVVVSVYGIFVIETKFYQGWIYGGVESEYWTQNIYGHKYQFLNPLRQNQGHCKAIARLLGVQDSIPIRSIIAFSSQASFQVNPTLPVMYWKDVVPYIKSFFEKHMSEAQADDIYKRLCAANVTDRTARKEHVQIVKRNQARRNLAITSGKCPRCGGNLVLRDGQYGRFYGCSNYPNCKYILK